MITKKLRINIVTSQGIQFTTNQKSIIGAAALSANKVIIVEALAGTGKTTTLEAITRNLPDNPRVLYLSFNRDIVEAARGRMPPWVDCMTSHGLAYRKLGYQYQDRLTAFIRSADIGAVIPRRVKKTPSTYYREVMNIVTRFCHSADSRIMRLHVKLDSVPDTEGSRELVAALDAHGLQDARTVWKKMADADFPVTHDVYLKKFVMDDGGSKLASHYDICMLDEFDCSPP